MVVQKFVLVIPANSGEALMAVAECMVDAQDERGHLDLPGCVGDEVIHRVPSLLARRVRQWDEFENLPGDRVDAPIRNLVIGKRLPEPECRVRYFFTTLGNGGSRVHTRRIIDSNWDPHGPASDQLSSERLTEIPPAFEFRGH